MFFQFSKLSTSSYKMLCLYSEGSGTLMDFFSSLFSRLAKIFVSLYIRQFGRGFYFFRVYTPSCIVCFTSLILFVSSQFDKASSSAFIVSIDRFFISFFQSLNSLKTFFIFLSISILSSILPVEWQHFKRMLRTLR